MTHDQNDTIAHAATRFLGKAASEISDRELSILKRAVAKRALSRDTNTTFEEDMTFGQRLADRVAMFGGSWTFLIVFAVILACWVTLNLGLASHAVDPYPFVFLNLILSMLAAVQAPIIMMSQNRQSSKDRLVASHDYEVNLKAEIEIMALHDKLDQLRNEDLRGLIATQQEQIAMLTRLVEKAAGKA